MVRLQGIETGSTINFCFLKLSQREKENLKNQRWILTDRMHEVFEATTKCIRLIELSQKRVGLAVCFILIQDRNTRSLVK